MPLRKTGPSLARRLLGGAGKGAANALLLQSLLGEEEVPEEDVPGTQSRRALAGFTPFQDDSEPIADFPVTMPSSPPPNLPNQLDFENMSLEEILRLVSSGMLR